MSEPEHSPLPWFRDSDDSIRDADGNRIGGFSGAGVLVDEFNAILTTTAVNSHAALLAAAKMAKDEIAPIPFTEESRAIWLSLQAAIAAAEEPAT